MYFFRSPSLSCVISVCVDFGLSFFRYGFFIALSLVPHAVRSFFLSVCMSCVPSLFRTFAPYVFLYVFR